MMRLPLAQSLRSRDGTTTKDSKLSNVICEVSGEESAVMKRPGLVKTYDLASGGGQGMVCKGGTLYVVRGDTLVEGPTTTPIPDGSTWTTYASGITGWNLSGGRRIAYDSENDTLYAIQSTTLKTQIGTGNWNSVTTSGLTDYDFTPCYFNGVLYAIGAHVGGGAGIGSSKVQYSSNGGLNWSSYVAPWPGRYSPVVWVFGGYMYVYGGIFSGYSLFNGDVWKTSDGTNWTQVTGHGLPTDVDNSAAVVAGGYVYVMSGTAVYRSSDSQTFTQVTSNAGFTVAKDMLGYSSGYIYAIDTAKGMWRSSGGSTWTLATAYPPFFSYTPIWIKTVGTALQCYAYTGGTSVNIYQNVANSPGGTTYSITGTAGLQFSLVGTSGASSTNYLFLKNSSRAWTLTGTTFAQVTDVDYPANTVPGAAYLDGYFFVMDSNGTIYNSDIENPTSWNSLNYINAEVEPDYGTGIAKYQNYIVAFGQWTTELFYDAANATGSPLAPVSNSFIQIGCANGYSIAQMDGMTVWMGNAKEKGRGIYAFNGSLTPQKISTPDVDRILNRDDLATVYSWGAKFDGHTLYVLTLKSSAITLVYDFTSQMWGTWTSCTAVTKAVSSVTQVDGVATVTCSSHGFSDGDSVTLSGATPSGYNVTSNITYVDANTFTIPVSSALASPATGTITAQGWTETYFNGAYYVNCGAKDLVLGEADGLIYEMTNTVYQDNGNVINSVIRTSKFDGGVSGNKFCSVAELVGDKVSSTAIIRWSDDDYVTNSKYKLIDLSAERSWIRRLGRFNRRSFEIRHTDNATFRMAALDISVGG